MNIQTLLNNCVTYRDLYALKKDFYNYGLYLTNTNNGTKVLCAIAEGVIKTQKLFEDYIFIEGKDNEHIPERLREVISVFVAENMSNNKLYDNTPSYLKNVEFYGKPLNKQSMLEEQQIKYISTLIQD
jgi:hypothetical protein